MKFEKIDCGNGIAVAVSSDSMIITDVDSALDLLMLPNTKQAQSILSWIKRTSLKISSF